MVLAVGLVGEPGSGKTTIFEALRAAPGGAGSAAGPVGTHIRTVEVHDERLGRLCEVYEPRKRTPVSIRFIDYPGKGGRGEARIASLREDDAFLIIVRGFPLGEGAPPPVGDAVRTVWEEWVLYDLEIVEGRLRKLEKSLRLRKDADEVREQALLGKIQAVLENGEGVRSIDLCAEEEKATRGFRFLTQKPSCTVLNVGEGGVDPRSAPGDETIVIRGQLEREIAELPEGDRAPFLGEMGVTHPAWLRVPAECLRTLDVVTFYTVVGEEVRAWTLPRGGTALDAAGKIHADVARGFVKAEVLHFDDFSAKKGPPPEKRKGRLEGRDYPVVDGDILTIRFTPR